ncbi:MAG: hypothetical protein P8011_00460 [Acidihalobacter sp.]
MDWLTLPKAAEYLSILFGEPVTEADVLRLGLDGRLRLSVQFVNHAYARCGVVATYAWNDLKARIEAGTYPEDLNWRQVPRSLLEEMGLLEESSEHAKGRKLKMLASIRIDEDRYLTLSDEVKPISGVWDLPMIGGEQLDVEHYYQSITGGPEVTLESLDGAFVEDEAGRVCQLQEQFIDLEPRKEELEQIREEFEQLREDRRAILEGRESLDSIRNNRFHPAGGLPSDGVIVVRMAALRELENAIRTKSPLTEREHNQNLRLIGCLALALSKRSDRFQHGQKPNASQIASLVQETLDALQDARVNGLGKSSVRDRISKGLKLLDG